MQDTLEVQQQYSSRTDIHKIASFDYEIIEGKKRPILHQEARFLYINKGKGRIKINEREYTVKENTLISLAPWDYTEIPEVKETFQYYLVVYNSFLITHMIKSAMNIEGENVPLLQTMTEHPLVYLEGKEAEGMKELFRKLREEVGIESTLDFPEKRQLSTIYTANLLIEIMIGFCRLTSNEHKENAVSYEEDKKARIYKYIFTHLSEKITLNKLSKLFYMSESTISKYIMDTTGLTFNNLLNEIRVAKTMNYLLYTDYTLEELASILGYVDAAHISKVFESRVENKISDYRKTYQKVLKICNIKERRMSYEVTSYVIENHREELTAKVVADHFHISVTELNGILIFQTERNFTDFLNFLRINSACELLVSGDTAITDIAIEVGYNTVKTFTRNFVHYKHMNPSNYRKNISLEYAGKE